MVRLCYVWLGYVWLRLGQFMLGLARYGLVRLYKRFIFYYPKVRAFTRFFKFFIVNNLFLLVYSHE